MQATTEASGKYRAGPLHDNVHYGVLARSQGYHLVQDSSEGGAINFRALKLGQIQVRVDMADTKEPVAGAPAARTRAGGASSNAWPPVCAGALLSLSGEGYRNNNASDAAGGLLFHSLFPGSYFLRPLLKEYRFDPPSKAVTCVSSRCFAVFSL